MLGKFRKTNLVFLALILVISSFLPLRTVLAIGEGYGGLRIVIQSGSYTFHADSCRFDRGTNTLLWPFSPAIDLGPGNQASRTSSVDDDIDRLWGDPAYFRMSYTVGGASNTIEIGPDPQFELDTWYTLPGSDAKVLVTVVIGAYVGAPSEWWMYHHDKKHTGYSSEQMQRPEGVQWSYQTGGAVKSSPAVAYGKVFVGSDDGYVYAFNENTGALLWRFLTGGRVRSSPLVVDQTVYIGSEDGRLYALSQADGTESWHYQTGGWVYSSPVLSVRSGTGGTPQPNDLILLFGSDDGYLYALDINSGTPVLKWRVTHNQGWGVRSSPAIWNGNVYIGWAGSPAGVECLDISDGHQIWWRAAINWVESSPVIADGIVYVLDHTALVMTFDANNGNPGWDYNTLNLAVYSSPSVAYGIVFACSGTTVYAFDQNSGSKLWDFSATAPIHDSSPAICSGMVFVGSFDNFVYVLDAYSGGLLGKYQTGGSISSSPAAVNEKVLVGSGDGKVYAFGRVPIPPPYPTMSNPYEYVLASIDSPETVDPAWAYDTASCELIYNVYETLIDFKGGSVDGFVPELATSWSISPDGLTYTFNIRNDVQWQDPGYGTLKSSDVEYSLERMMVRDYTGGPAWMLYQPILGQVTANDTGELTNPPNAYTIALGQAIDAAITSNDLAGTVTIQFATGVPYAPFQAILAHTCASVLSKNWAIDHGDWPGTGLQDGTWVGYHDPATSPLDGPPNVMMGTGPYRLDYLNQGIVWSIVRFHEYWGGWGNPRRGFAARGYLERVTEYVVVDWPTRLAGFTGANPIYDSIYVARSYIPEVWQLPRVKCWYPQKPLSLDALFFSYDVGITSPYIGSPTGYGYFGELGITPDFFSDIHCRKAIAYSVNWAQYISAAWLGEATQLTIPMKPELPFYNGSISGYGINLAAATAEWMLAWGGQVWANGFSFTIVYNMGNLGRQIAAEMIKNSLEAQNPKFHVNTVAVSWEAYRQVLHGGPGGRAAAPMFIDGWTADFADVHDFVAPFMASWGYFGLAQSLYLDPQSGLMDQLINWGFYNTTYDGRMYNYNQLYQLYIQEVPSVPLCEPLGRRWAYDWVHGWYYNPLFSGSDAAYIGESVKSNFYSMWKEDFYASTGTFAGKYANWEDVNEDGKVDIKDLATAAKAYGGYFIQPALPPHPVGPPGTYSANWDSRADVNIVNVITYARGDMKIDIKDLATMAKLFGFMADPWIPPP